MQFSSGQLSRAVGFFAAFCGMLLCLYFAVTGLSFGAFHVLTASFVLMIAYLLTVCVLLRWPLFRSPQYAMAAIIILFPAICLRLSLLDNISGDYVSFLSHWTETMRNMTVREAMSTPIGDYNMPYLYLILLASRLPLYDLYTIKLYSILGDLAVALAVVKLISLVRNHDRTIFIGFTLALFAPTVWLNSAYWGQCDSIYAAFALWGLYCGLKKKPVVSMVLFAFSLAFKLQAVFILPIMAFLLVTDRVKCKHLPVFPAAFLVSVFPPILFGRSLRDTFSIYVNQTSAYPYLSLNAPSFWSLIPNDFFTNFSAATLIVCICALLVVLFFALKRYDLLKEAALMELSFIFALMIPWLLPRMHERYFFLAELLSIVYIALHPRRLPVGICLLFGGFLIYSVYLFGAMPILSMQYVAVCYGAALLFVILRFYQALYHTPVLKSTSGGNHNGT